MDEQTRKRQLREFYDTDAARRDVSEKSAWKLEQRDKFRTILAAEQKSTLLELGAGTGADSRFFMDGGLRVTAVDISEEMVAKCREKSVEAYAMDYYDLAPLGRTFDAVWSINSLLHVPKTELPHVLREVASVLNVGGVAYIGMYGGSDTENVFRSESLDKPRYFAFHSERTLREMFGEYFDVLEVETVNIDDDDTFIAAILRKRARQE